MGHWNLVVIPATVSGIGNVLLHCWQDATPNWATFTPPVAQASTGGQATTANVLMYEDTAILESGNQNFPGHSNIDLVDLSQYVSGLPSITVKGGSPFSTGEAAPLNSAGLWVWGGNSVTLQAGSYYKFNVTVKVTINGILQEYSGDPEMIVGPGDGTGSPTIGESG